MEQRIALVIGNAAYSYISRLRNPVKDAAAVARTLVSLGFELADGRAILDADRPEIERGLNLFVNRLTQDSIALFYYSGHGLQLGGANYLIPIKAGATRETHIESELVDVGRLLSQMEAARTRLNMIILDACRSDPFQGRSFRSSTGLAPMQARSGTILSYATQPGNVAYDGEGENSPFVEALVEVWKTPRLDALAAFNRVGILVKQRTGNRQVPWMTNSPVETHFIFNTAPIPDPEPPPPQARAEAAVGPPSSGAWWLAAQPGPAPVAGSPAGGGPAAFTSLQEAIDAAPDGGVVTVPPGRHVGALRISKSLELAGSPGAATAVIEPEGDVVALTIAGAGRVTVRGLIFRMTADNCCIEVEGGEVTVEDCTIGREADGTPEDGYATGLRANEGAVATVRRCRVAGFRFGLVAGSRARVVVDSSEIEGDWSASDEVESPRAVFGLWAGGGATLGVIGETAVRRYRNGVTVQDDGRAELSSARLSICLFGVFTTGGGASASAIGCGISDVSYGMRADDGSRQRIEDCDISATSEAIRASRSIVEVSRCHRIHSTGDDGLGVSARDQGTVSIAECRIFGGGGALSCSEGSTIVAKACEAFDVSTSAVSIDAGGVVKLESCDVHHSGYQGVFSTGRIEVDECLIHDNGDCGIVNRESSRFTVRGCSIYRNRRAGFTSHDDAQGTVSGSTVILHTHAGLAFFDRSVATLSGCTIRQNPNGGLVVSGQSRVSLTSSDVSRNVVTNEIAVDRGATLIESGNRKTISRDCKPSEGSGGRENRLSYGDYFFAPLSEVIDQFEALAKQAYRDWGREAPELSPDGREVKYSFLRSYNERIKAETASIWSRMAAGFEASQGGAIGKFVSLPYELRTTVTLRASEGFGGIDRVKVEVAEEEHIDRYGNSGLALGRHYRAPSNIRQEQAGCKLLNHLEVRLCPPVPAG